MPFRLFFFFLDALRADIATSILFISLIFKANVFKNRVYFGVKKCHYYKQKKLIVSCSPTVGLLIFHCSTFTSSNLINDLNLVLVTNWKISQNFLFKPRFSLILIIKDSSNTWRVGNSKIWICIIIYNIYTIYLFYFSFAFHLSMF